MKNLLNFFSLILILFIGSCLVQTSNNGSSNPSTPFTQSAPQSSQSPYSSSSPYQSAFPVSSNAPFTQSSSYSAPSVSQSATIVAHVYFPTNRNQSIEVKSFNNDSLLFKLRDSFGNVFVSELQRNDNIQDVKVSNVALGETTITLAIKQDGLEKITNQQSFLVSPTTQSIISPMVLEPEVVSALQNVTSLGSASVTASITFSEGDDPISSGGICSLPIDRNSIINTQPNHIYVAFVTTNDNSQVDSISIRASDLSSYNDIEQYPIASVNIPNGKAVVYNSSSYGLLNYMIKVRNDCKGYNFNVVDFTVSNQIVDDSFDFDELYENYDSLYNTSLFNSKSLRIKNSNSGLSLEIDVNPQLVSACSILGSGVGFLASGSLSAACDGLSYGGCVVANPAIMMGGTALGATAGGAVCSAIPNIISLSQLALENAFQNTTAKIDSARIRLEDTVGFTIRGTITLYQAYTASQTNIGNPTRARSNSFRDPCKPSNQIAHHIIAFLSQFALPSRLIVNSCAEQQGKSLEDIIDTFSSNGACLDKDKHDGLHKKKEYYDPINSCIKTANNKGGCQAVYSMISTIGTMLTKGNVRDFRDFESKGCGY